MDDRYLPHLFIALGVALGALTVGQLVAMGLSPSPPDALDLSNAASSVPFIGLLVGGGYWLLQGALPTNRFRRMAGWSAAGLVFVGSFFLFVALNVAGDPLGAISIFRWGVASGAGGGFLVGLFEARAIQRAVAAERAQVRAAELRRQNQRLEEFAGIIAHDIRNPLNVATGHLELVRDDGQNGALGTVADALGRVEQILTETLTLARSGQVVGEMERMDLAALGPRCWSHVDTRAATIAFGDLPTIRGDADRIEHLLENLFRNAVEHGGDDVSVRLGALPDGFYVEDDGPGIPEADRESVLEAGYSTGGGTGFGLAIVAEIVHAHGWQLSVTEGTEGGARFEITEIDILDATARPSAELAAGRT